MVYFYVNSDQYFFSDIFFLNKKCIAWCLFLFVVSYSLDAQAHYISINIGVSSTSRILGLNNNVLSEDEIIFARKLEISKPTYDFGIGYVRLKNDKMRYELGAFHRWLRFGSRIYRIDGTTFNPTPQYPRVREIVQQNQFSVYCKYFFKLKSQSKNTSFFIQTDGVFNYKNYLIRRISYDEKDEVGIVAKGSGDAFRFHPFNVRISLGGIHPIWQLKNKSLILLNYYIGGYIQPYNVFGRGIGGYLIFDKDISGWVWDLGVKLQYRFNNF